MARIFAAILLPADVEAHLDEHVDAVRGAHPELRWVAPSRWHVTLEFLGECGPHEVARQVERWARRAARVEPFELSLTGAGAFPKTWQARVLWTGLAGGVDAWRKLAGYQQEPHMTLARTRQRADLTGVVHELASYEGPAWSVTEIALVESRLPGKGGGKSGPGKNQSRGPRYQPLEYFPLG
jgi:2'-5' RNA ligase